jgi:hypothetical protein
MRNKGEGGLRLGLGSSLDLSSSFREMGGCGLLVTNTPHTTQNSRNRFKATETLMKVSRVYIQCPSPLQGICPSRTFNNKFHEILIPLSNRIVTTHLSRSRHNFQHFCHLLLDSQLPVPVNRVDLFFSDAAEPFPKEI